MSRWKRAWNRSWYRNWFGIEIDGSIVGGYGESGVATLVLDLEAGFTVKHRWITNIIKARAGNEQRISRNEIDHESYVGDAYLLGDRPRKVRAQLARHASAGGVFLLALPHEAIALSADAVGATIPVSADELALVDWAKPGQRAAGASLDDGGEVQYIDVIVQSKTSDTIRAAPAPGAVGKYGGWIMPVKHVYLEPQQDFPRFPVDAEIWKVQARGAVPLDFAPDLAYIVLGGLSAPFADAIATCRRFGPIGNTFTLAFEGNAGYPDTGELIEAGSLTTFRYKPNTTTLGDLATALASSLNFVLTGSWESTDTFTGTEDHSTTAALGADHGDAGTGATLTTYSGDGATRPVWDREINIDSTVSDGIHAMNMILDYGGKPQPVRLADKADWYRAVRIDGGDHYDYQWLKLFMATARGNSGKFWLPTWRDDFVYVSHAGTSLDIDSADDFNAWWPAQRQDLQIEQADGTIAYVRVTEAVDNGDGTRTLTLSASLSGSAVTRIGWLELCRFENADEYDTVHGPNGFEMTLTARVVP